VIVDYESSRERYGGKAEFLIASLHLCGTPERTSTRRTTATRPVPT